MQGVPLQGEDLEWWSQPKIGRRAVPGHWLENLPHRTYMTGCCTNTDTNWISIMEINVIRDELDDSVKEYERLTDELGECRGVRDAAIKEVKRWRGLHDLQLVFISSRSHILSDSSYIDGFYSIDILHNGVLWSRARSFSCFERLLTTSTSKVECKQKTGREDITNSRFQEWADDTTMTT